MTSANMDGYFMLVDLHFTLVCHGTSLQGVLIDSIKCPTPDNLINPSVIESTATAWSSKLIDK